MKPERLDIADGVTILTDFARGSYEVIGRLYRLTLEGAGVPVTEEPIPANAEEREKAAERLAGKIVLHNTIGPLFHPLPRSFNIALPHHEWSRYPKGWVDTLNRFDEVWATSDFVVEIMRESGVTAPILFMPPALDADTIPQKTDWKAGAPFRFYSCGEAHFRKGFHLLMEGFMEAFPKPGAARLVIKTSASLKWTPPREDIQIVTQWITRDDLLADYKNHDAYVSASLGEGLGLPLAEAALAGLPVAANFWGGHESLLVEGGFFKMESSVVDQFFCSDPSYFAKGQQCALSTPQMIAAALRRVYESAPEERRTVAEFARERVLSRYAMEVCAGMIKRRLEILAQA
jgi:glycosyltransferase involved in cell wall biosynthesis